MPELIVAMDRNGGIGYKNQLPWNNKDELKIFREKTMGKNVVFGMNTYKNIPKLEGRNIYVVTRNPTLDMCLGRENVKIINDFDILDTIYEDRKNILIAGGRQIYKLALEKPGFITKIHISIMNDSYKCDTFFDCFWLQDYVITDEVLGNGFIHYVLEYFPYGEGQYLSILRKLVEYNKWRESRNAMTCSMFKNDMTFDLRNGFPLLTTKKMFLRGVIEELIFFINGKTNTKELEEKGVNIWKGNTSQEFLDSRHLPYAEGVMGPLYGYQWRYFNSPYYLDSKKTTAPPVGGVDQLKNVINLIKNEPNSRRILMTSFNPTQAELGVLYPCHSITIQFYVEDDYLDMFCYNRSQDFVLGTPFNIASSSLLLMLVAKMTDKTPRFFHMTLGDTHIYEQHLDGAHTILERIPYMFPTLEIPNVKTLEDLSGLKAEQFVLKKYCCHPVVKVPMIA